LYRDAGAALVKLQQASLPSVFPAYDRAMLEREMALYPDWYVARHKGVILSVSQRESLAQACALLAEAALAQPQVYVHRDWHSRNLMRIDADRNPGVLDFQDAVQGPITYDLVSLLRDAYIRWPEAQQIDWAIRYWEAARKAHLPVADDFGDFYRDFEWMGLQRQLKVLGIFARLQHRDGKSRYLADLPRVLEYALAAARRYQALSGLVRVLEEVENIAPAETGLTF
jgi:aminoglycoside/choline kinase family phosphotransferase